MQKLQGGAFRLEGMKRFVAVRNMGKSEEKLHWEVPGTEGSEPRKGGLGGADLGAARAGWPGGTATPFLVLNISPCGHFTQPQ